jgi:uncharacterized protein YukE
MIRYTDAIDTAGDDVITCADRIRTAGQDMYDNLRNLISSGQLTGEGIATALDESQTRWNSACDEFAQAEQDFGTKTKDSYANMMAADHRGAGYIAT